MASWKCVWHAVLLLLPCKPGLLSTLSEDLLQDTTNLVLGCHVPEDGCPNSNITYWLYTRDTQDSPYQLDPSDLNTFENANFVQGAPLKVIFHGYTGYRDYSPNMELRPAYFAQGEYNIITVDWGALALSPCYVQAVANVELVAKCAAAMLDSLYLVHTNFNVNNTHILGFSLGAHVAGIMAANIASGIPSRVTGFDPALPLFDPLTKSKEEMINSDCGQFVDVYHSNMGFKGKKDKCGDVDVYFNNGANQPGCNCNSSCDHVRSVEYFAEGINSETGLWGFLCDSWDTYKKGGCPVSGGEQMVALGDDISTQLSGVFLSFTNNVTAYLLEPSVYMEDANLIDKVDWSCNLLEYVF